MQRELLLGSTELLLNSVLRLDAQLQSLLQPLAGKVLCLKLSQPELQCYCLFGPDRIDLLQNYAGIADAGILGELGQLLDFLRPATRNRAQVTLSGDLELIQQVQRLLSQLSPDWQSRLSRFIGEPLTAMIEQRLQRDLTRLPSGLQQFGQNLSELLRDEAQLSVGHAQLEASREQLQQLRSQIHQLERRLGKLEQAR